MSPRLPAISSRDLAKLLRAKGFELSRQTGSHAIYKHRDGRRTTVPMHGSRDLGRGLLRQIMRDADLTVEDLVS